MSFDTHFLDMYPFAFALLLPFRPHPPLSLPQPVTCATLTLSVGVRFINDLQRQWPKSQKRKAASPPPENHPEKEIPMPQATPYTHTPPLRPLCPLCYQFVNKISMRTET